MIQKILQTQARPAAIPLIIAMTVAMISIKIPFLLGHGFWDFSLRELPHYGFWRMLHESRDDLCMIFGFTFLLVVGAGRLSLDTRAASNCDRYVT